MQTAPDDEGLMLKTSAIRQFMSWAKNIPYQILLMKTLTHIQLTRQHRKKNNFLQK